MKLPKLAAWHAAIGGYIAGSGCVSVGVGILLGTGAALVSVGAFMLLLSYLIARGIANHG